MAPPKGSRWPEERLALLRQLDAEGLSYKAMARRLGCTEETIRRQRAHCGLPNRAPALFGKQREQPEAPRFHRGASTLPPLASQGGER